MNPYKTKVILLTIFIFTLLLPYSQITSGQELGGGAKLVGATPFLFAEAKFWLFAVEVGADLNSMDTEDSNYKEPSPIDFSLAGKLYPIKIMNFSPYLGLSTRYSSSF